MVDGCETTYMGWKTGSARWVAEWVSMQRGVVGLYERVNGSITGMQLTDATQRVRMERATGVFGRCLCAHYASSSDTKMVSAGTHSDGNTGVSDT